MLKASEEQKLYKLTLCSFWLDIRLDPQLYEMASNPNSAGV